MNAVIGMSRMLMESDLPPDLYECAETIESSGMKKLIIAEPTRFTATYPSFNLGNHLMALIDDILDYSKIESGNLVMDNSLLDLVRIKLEKSMAIHSST